MKGKFLLIILIIITLGIGIRYLYITGLVSTKMDKKAHINAPSVKKAQKVEQKILVFDLTNYAEDGKQKWHLRGGSADIFANIVSLSNIRMESYSEPKVTLTASKGSYNKENKEISLYNNVNVSTSDGTKLITEYLKWDSITDIITTDKPVMIVRSDVIACGKGAEAYPQFKRIVLKNDVKVELTKGIAEGTDNSSNKKESNRADYGDADKLSTTVITCNGPLEIDYREDKAIFRNDVVVNDKKGKIYSDKMEAYLDPATKNIVKVIAEGDVRVVRDEDSTYSQKVIYTTEDQKIILIGQPKIYIHSTDQLDKMEKQIEGI